VTWLKTTADRTRASRTPVVRKTLFEAVKVSLSREINILRRDIQLAADSLDRGEGSEIDWEAKLAALHLAHRQRQG
jgi:hypothetical protein